jgi:hypothetical protein
MIRADGRADKPLHLTALGRALARGAIVDARAAGERQDVRRQSNRSENTMIQRLSRVLSVIAVTFGAALSQADAQWLESRAAHYTVFYQPGFERDVEFTRKWLDATEQLMTSKYAASPDRYFMSVYLLPAPTGDIDAVQSGQNQCCSTTSTGARTGTIRLLTRSAPIWKTGNLSSSLGLPKAGDDYHAKVLISEYIPIGHYAAQDSRTSGGWQYYSAPQWFVQGLQEYDAIFHSTERNGISTRQRLLQWAKTNSSTFSCCSPNLAITDRYNGGATFMAFLAAEFGEDIHARLLRNPANTFEAALASETQKYSLTQLFDRFRHWLDTVQP